MNNRIITIMLLCGVGTVCAMEKPATPQAMSRKRVVNLITPQPRPGQESAWHKLSSLFCVAACGCMKETADLATTISNSPVVTRKKQKTD